MIARANEHVLILLLEIHKIFSFSDEILRNQLQDETRVGTETWDEPVKCAKFIERFTSHTLSDAENFDLKNFTRNDLEGIIHLLHGFYSHFVLDNPMDIRENMKCSADDVLTSMALASSIHYNDDGEIILSDELWDLVKESPILLKFLTCARADGN